MTTETGTETDRTATETDGTTTKTVTENARMSKASWRLKDDIYTGGR